ncbi:MAG: substrate-binding domain-containing protein, partial [Blastocatellia bacterium]|nr:substrate-binding domain-containing protein [Blastocatellia bacterium]
MQNRKIINIIIVLAFLGLCIGIVYFRFIKDSPSSSEGPVSDSPAPAGDAVTISFYSSDGKKDWVEDITKEFNAKRVEVDGRPIFVKLEHIRSGESYRKIMDGDPGERPTIWGPVSRSWFDLINKRWSNLKGGEFATDIRPTVKIALVIAMWEPMASALGYPAKPIGWSDIVKVATQPGGWSNYGHPEWGQFRFGHAHPDYSTSAMLSVISATYAAAGKTAGLSAADLQNPSVVNSVGALERAIVHYGESSSWLIEKICTRGPSYLSAVPVYESSVIAANTKFPNKPFKLVAVYPKEGTFWESHPAGIVQADWVTEEQKKAARVYLDFLVAREQQARTYNYGFRPAIDGLPPASPFDIAHGVDPQAPQRELEDVSEEVFQRANELWHKVKKKATIIMLLDVSGSMQGPAL